MADIAAIIVSEVLGSQVTDDGQHAVIKARPSTGGEVNLAVPISELYKFIEGFSLSATQVEKKARQKSNVKPTFNTTWYEIGRTPTNSVVLSLTFGAGAVLSFQMSRSMAEQMRETLIVQLGEATPEEPRTRH